MKKKLLATTIIFFFLVFISYGQSNNERNNQLSTVNTTSPISVTVGGDFIITGSFPAFSGERVDQFITRIHTQALSNMPLPNTDEKVFLNLISEAKDYALRGIILKNKDGKEKKIDLLKFRLTGNFDNNPYLHNDDVIIFPSYDSEYETVEVNGAVKKPTKFQFVEGDKLSDAIFFARGINDAYENVEKAIISRLSYDASEEELIEVNLGDEFYLKPGDRIKIQADQTKRKNYKILVLGEVKNPGEIYITENSTTIQEVISKAGGFTNKASLKDAELVRNFSKRQVLLNEALKIKAKEDPSLLITPDTKKIDFEQIKEILRMNRAADLFEEDTVFFNLSNQLRVLEGDGRIDFRELEDTNSIASNFIVKNGDVIVVPQKMEAVYVFGQVAIPGYYKFSEDSDYSYYINKAGGLTETAKDDDEIYVIKGKGREWINIEDKYKIEPGDYIYVLKEIPRDGWYYVGRVGTIAGILGGIATLVLLFK